MSHILSYILLSLATACGMLAIYVFVTWTLGEEKKNKKLSIRDDEK
jgi:hypothetical protein